MMTKKQKVGYGAGEFSSSIFWITVAFWLMNYLTDEVGLSAGLAGTAIMIGKVWDAVTDPAVGFLSDRTRSRWGRRRPWFLFAALPFGLSYFLMFSNPRLDGETLMFVYVSLVFVLLCSSYTCANIPYNSLLPELAKGFDERTSLAGYKSIFAAVGTILGAGAAMPIISHFPNKTHGFMAMGAIFGSLIVISVLIPFFFVEEPAVLETTNSTSIFRSNLEAFGNRPFLLILISWTFNTIGVTVVSATLIYYFKYVFNDETLITTASIIMLLTSMFFIPVTVKIAERLGKRKTYIVGLSIVIASVVTISQVGHLLGITAVFLLMFVAGIGFSAHYVLPWAIIPDTIEFDYSISGVRREGTYYGLWTFMIKLGQAIAAFSVGMILSSFGYVPDVAQTESALFGIRLLIGPITAVFFGVGILFLWFYPIDEEEYRNIQLRIAEMEEKKVT